MPRSTNLSTPLTVSEVVALLKKLGLQVPDREGFSAIRAAEGTKFSTALASLREPDFAAQTQREYVESVVCAAVPETRELFSSQGYPAEIVRLIEIATREGRSFRNAVRLVITGANSGEVKSAMDYLIGLLDEYGGAMPFNMDDMRFLGTEDQELCRRAPLPKAHGEPRVPEATPQLHHVGLADAPKKLFGDSFHIYGLKAVVCVAELSTPSNNKATISFEVAQRTAEGKAQWQDKAALMLSAHEQPLCLGVFLGYLQKLEIKGHGRQQEKAMTIVNQGNQFFLSMIVRGQSPRAVPIPAEYAYPLVAMLIGQMRKNDPHMPPELILQVTKAICEMRGAERCILGEKHG
jgi:hypothetical protein